MNPVQSTDMPQLYGHSMHAGGWPKLGWEQTEQEFDVTAGDDAESAEEARGLFS